MSHNNDARPGFFSSYLLGLRIAGIKKFFKGNITAIVRSLRLIGRGHFINKSDYIELKKLLSRVYIFSPWMWKQKCLYISLMEYYFCPGAVLNIGFDISEMKNEGHCWITMDGLIPDKDQENLWFSNHYRIYFSRKGDVIYWLPAKYRETEKVSKLFGFMKGVRQ